MILYHGTWEENKDNILKLGIIENDNSIYSFEDTDFLNSVFEKHIGYNPRNLCIYLSNDKDTIEAYDFAFKIDTNFLNTNLLYVGSNKIAQDIYLETTKYIPDENKIKKLVYNYEDTFISFDEYLKTNGEINSDLEFLYFGSIKVSENDLY